MRGEALADYVERVFGEIQSRQFFAGEPAGFGSIAGGGDFSRNPAAEKINQYVVILHALFGIAQDAVVDSEQFTGLDGESSFFAGLADNRFPDQFAHFQDASGNRPLSLQRRMSALNQHYARAFDDDGADADQWSFGEFAVHSSIEERTDSIADSESLFRRGWGV